MKNIKNKIKKIGEACDICAARFEIWLDNAKFSDERKETVKEKLLNYCPACSRAD